MPVLHHVLHRQVFADESGVIICNDPCQLMMEIPSLVSSLTLLLCHLRTCLLPVLRTLVGVVVVLLSG